MLSPLQKLITKLTTTTIVVFINECVHYCGFRYGHDEYNPYETYINRLHYGVNNDLINYEFVEFLRYYRPYTLGEALGITLSKPYPLWTFPWNKFNITDFNLLKGWYNDLEGPPDILTHYCTKGIPYSRINQEIVWLERAYKSIKAFGYSPKKFRNFITVKRLRNLNGKNSYLVLDGNHRLSALSALGHKHIICKCSQSDDVYEGDINNWFGIKNSLFSIEDAKCIFHAYFNGNNNYRTTDTPAKLIYDFDYVVK